VQAAQLKPPCIIVIGSVVSLRSELKWFEQRPLFGKAVLVTRPRHQAADFARRLEELGAVAHIMPVIELCDPSDWAPVDLALANLAAFQWLVFTSANGVHALVRRLRETGHDLRLLGPLKLAAIGSSTADALRGYHLNPDLVPVSYRSESLADALEVEVTGRHVLLIRADRGREVLREQLSRFADVDQIAVYSQVDVLKPASHVFELLRYAQIDYVTLTSSNIARAFLRLAGEGCRARIASGQIKLVSISPVTSEAIRELGMPVAAEARRYTSDGIIEALLDHAAKA
jgi:uroporphyrinogen III methyltransferase/synthase